jgi:hypothetical protein
MSMGLSLLGHGRPNNAYMPGMAMSTGLAHAFVAAIEGELFWQRSVLDLNWRCQPE